MQHWFPALRFDIQLSIYNGTIIEQMGFVNSRQAWAGLSLHQIKLIKYREYQLWMKTSFLTN
jgi:hypothetical protein